MAQINVVLKDGRKAIIDTAKAEKGTYLIQASIEGAPFSPIRKSKIAPSTSRRVFGTLGDALLAAASY